jgi:hypothetical protein
MNPVEKVIHAVAQKIQNTTGLFTKFFAFIGIVTILSFASIGIIRIGPGIIKAVSQAAVSLSGNFVPAPRLNLESTKYTVGSGETFTLSWTFDKNTETEGSYLLSYPCAQNMHVEIVDSTSGEYRTAFCNTYINFMTDDNSVRVRAFANPRDPITFPITVYFTKNGSNTITSRAQAEINVAGSGSVIQTPSNNTQPTRTSNPRTTNSPTTRTYTVTQNRPATTAPAPAQNQTPRVYGQGIDLTPRIIATGIVSTTTDEFIPKKQIGYRERGAIKFEVENVGDKTSTEWSFSMILPTYPEYTFLSEQQPPLAPGDKVEYTIAFDSIKREEKAEFLINVDNTGSVNDTNRSNNIKRSSIEVDLR